MNSQPLSNVQEELLKLYSTDLSDAELHELKLLLSKFYALKASHAADKIWVKKNYSDSIVEDWLNEG